MTEPPSPSEREQLARAAELHRPLARAAKLARANGTGYVVFGVLTWMFSLSDMDNAALLLGIALLAAGLAERRAAARLAGADPEAPRKLAQVEVMLLVSIAIYCILKLTWLRPDGHEISSTIQDAVPDVDVKAMLDASITAFYGLVLAISLAYQGGMARYFSRRAADVARFREEVPDWARDVIRGL